MTDYLGAFLNAIRLTDWGIALLLARLCLARALDHWHDRRLPPSALPLQFVHPIRVVLASTMLALSQIVAFSFPIIQHGIWWLASHHLPTLSLLPALWLIGASQTVLIYSLAYHPRRKMVLCAGWMIAAHIFLVVMP